MFRMIGDPSLTSATASTSSISKLKNERVNWRYRRRHKQKMCLVESEGAIKQFHAHLYKFPEVDMLLDKKLIERKRENTTS
jgi:hypothetical protein